MAALHSDGGGPFKDLSISLALHTLHLKMCVKVRSKKEWTELSPLVKVSGTERSERITIDSVNLFYRTGSLFFS